MAPWLKELTALPKDQGTIPSTHKAIQSSATPVKGGIQRPLLASRSTACRSNIRQHFLKVFLKRSILRVLAFKSETEGIFSSKKSSPSCSSELATHSISSCRWSAAAALSSAGISAYRTIWLRERMLHCSGSSWSVKHKSLTACQQLRCSAAVLANAPRNLRSNSK